VSDSVIGNDRLETPRSRLWVLAAIGRKTSRFRGTFAQA
jgi:hypothetical protein